MGVDIYQYIVLNVYAHLKTHLENHQNILQSCSSTQISHFMNALKPVKGEILCYWENSSDVVPIGLNSVQKMSALAVVVDKWRSFISSLIYFSNQTNVKQFQEARTPKPTYNDHLLFESYNRDYKQQLVCVNETKNEPITKVWKLETENKVVHVKVKRELKTGTRNKRTLKGRVFTRTTLALVCLNMLCSVRATNSAHWFWN